MLMWSLIWCVQLWAWARKQHYIIIWFLTNLAEITKRVVKMIYIDLLPLRIVDHSGFKDLMQILDSERLFTSLENCCGTHDEWVWAAALESKNAPVVWRCLWDSYDYWSSDINHSEEFHRCDSIVCRPAVENAITYPYSGGHGWLAHGGEHRWSLDWLGKEVGHHRQKKDSGHENAKSTAVTTKPLDEKGITRNCAGHTLPLTVVAGLVHRRTKHGRDGSASMQAGGPCRPFWFGNIEVAWILGAELAN